MCGPIILPTAEPPGLTINRPIALLPAGCRVVRRAAAAPCRHIFSSALAALQRISAASSGQPSLQAHPPPEPRHMPGATVMKYIGSLPLGTCWTAWMKSAEDESRDEIIDWSMSEPSASGCASAAAKVKTPVPPVPEAAASYVATALALIAFGSPSAALSAAGTVMEYAMVTFSVSTVGFIVGVVVGVTVGFVVGASVTVGASVAVGVAVGAVVAVGVGVGIGDGRGEGNGVGASVAVGVAVGSGVGTAVGVAVGSGVGVAVGASVLVGASVDVGVVVGIDVGVVDGAKFPQIVYAENGLPPWSVVWRQCRCRTAACVKNRVSPLVCIVPKLPSPRCRP